VIVDYHMHLRAPDETLDHSLDAVERFTDMAGARGVDEVGFTEHVYYFVQTRPVWSLPYQVDRCTHDLDRYCDVVLEAKRRGMRVKLGLEVDFVPGHVEDLARALAPYPWDFLLGSVHWIDGFAIDQKPGIWSHMDVSGVWHRYFDELRGAARSGLFDVLSHPDLVNIFGQRPAAAEVRRHYAESAAEIGRAGLCVEISTAGLRKPVGQLYPDGVLLAACRAEGVPITLASDAHVPADVGRDFDQATALARQAGYTTVSTFDGRRRRQEPLC
jgi:histidinol-phosphatase (PHP family)